MNMPRHVRHSRYLAPAALLLAAASVLSAQDAAGPPQDPGAPERGVARISITSGEVSVRRGDSGEWVAASSMHRSWWKIGVSTGTGSRAEVQFDSANLIRVGAKAEIRLAELATTTTICRWPTAR